MLLLSVEIFIYNYYINYIYAVFLYNFKRKYQLHLKSVSSMAAALRRLLLQHFIINP